MMQSFNGFDRQVAGLAPDQSVDPHKNPILRSRMAYL
jgi:hypothetical protein